MSTHNICNICGANYEYRNGRWVCPACGAYKPEELSNEEVTLLYNAAQKLRLADFDEAEKAFARFFERIMNKYPQIKGECRCLGVQESTSSFNVFRISIPCDEIDRAPLRRVLVKEFSLFCEEEKINKL